MKKLNVILVQTFEISARLTKQTNQPKRAFVSNQTKKKEIKKSMEYLLEQNAFQTFLLGQNAFRTFLAGQFDEVDIVCLKLTCKKAREELDKIFPPLIGYGKAYIVRKAMALSRWTVAWDLMARLDFRVPSSEMLYRVFNNFRVKDPDQVEAYLKIRKICTSKKTIHLDDVIRSRSLILFELEPEKKWTMTSVEFCLQEIFYLHSMKLIEYLIRSQDFLKYFPHCCCLSKPNVLEHIADPNILLVFRLVFHDDSTFRDRMDWVTVKFIMDNFCADISWIRFQLSYHKKSEEYFDKYFANLSMDEVQDLYFHANDEWLMCKYFDKFVETTSLESRLKTVQWGHTKLLTKIIEHIIEKDLEIDHITRIWLTCKRPDLLSIIFSRERYPSLCEQEFDYVGKITVEILELIGQRFPNLQQTFFDKLYALDQELRNDPKFRAWLSKMRPKKPLFIYPHNYSFNKFLLETFPKWIPLDPYYDVTVFDLETLKALEKLSRIDDEDYFQIFQSFKDSETTEYFGAKISKFDLVSIDEHLIKGKSWLLDYMTDKTKPQSGLLFIKDKKDVLSKLEQNHYFILYNRVLSLSK